MIITENQTFTEKKPRKKYKKGSKVDCVLLQNLAELQCTMEEMASRCGVSSDTLYRDPKLMKIIDDGRRFGCISLRRKQYEVAMSGNVQMLMHLGRHYLGQHDQIKLTTTEPEVRTLLKRWEDQMKEDKKHYRSGSIEKKYKAQV